MEYLTDIEIAQRCEMQPITEIAARAGIDDKYVEQYGKYKAKIDLSLMKENKNPDGKLILVTAITPTPAGEGKTTTTIGLADGMRRIGKNVMVALREPSLGPVFGIKGGAAGGGYAQVVPMEDINLHFTGDFHAIGAANNLLAAMLELPAGLSAEEPPYLRVLGFTAKGAEILNRVKGRHTLPLSASLAELEKAGEAAARFAALEARAADLYHAFTPGLAPCGSEYTTPVIKI